MRCTTYSTAIRLIGRSIHAAATISARRVAAESSIAGEPSPLALRARSLRSALRAEGGGSSPPSAGRGSRAARGYVFRNATNRSSARSMQNTSTPLIRWITMLVTLNGHGSPLPKYQLSENVSEANGRRRKLEGEDSAEFTHAASVECPRVMWMAALSMMFG